ncbi:MAG: hypothetical protein IPK04_22840 [Bdellovibrionales bacterium]|nr:hypothetical protein [Bdellovibrionales bacterium]
MTSQTSLFIAGIIISMVMVIALLNTMLSAFIFTELQGCSKKFKSSGLAVVIFEKMKTKSHDKTNKQDTE